LKRASTVPVILVALLSAAATASDTVAPPDGRVDPGTAAILGGAVGNADPSALHGVAARLSADELVTAAYRGDRTQRLVALGAAAELDYPWPVLPYLAALMGARERQIASRAAAGIERGLDRAAQRRGGDGDVASGQLEQLAGILMGVASDAGIEADLRAVALGGLSSLRRMGGARPRTPLGLLEDPEPAVRRGAIAMIEPPLAEDDLAALLAVATDDVDGVLAGQAAGLMCENALAHGVKAPSPDLEKVLAEVIASAEDPAALCPLLACLVRFAPEARSSLVTAALRNPDPRVERYWQDLQN